MNIRVCIWMSGRPFEKEAAQVLAASVKTNWGLPSYTFETMQDLQELSADSEYMIVMTPFTIVRGMKDSLDQLVRAPFTATCKFAGVPVLIENGKEAFYNHLSKGEYERMQNINMKYIRPDLMCFKSSWINEKPVNFGMSFVDDINSRIGETLIIPNRTVNTPDLFAHSITMLPELFRQRENAFSTNFLCVSPFGYDLTDNNPATWDLQIPWESYRYFAKIYSKSEEYLALIDSKVSDKTVALFDIKRRLKQV